MLKCTLLSLLLVTPCVGVWIETSKDYSDQMAAQVTPCVGVWIETMLNAEQNAALTVTPCVGVWIETQWEKHLAYAYKSHPAWVCGLKQN